MSDYLPQRPSETEARFLAVTGLAFFLGLGKAWIEYDRTAVGIGAIHYAPSVSVSGLRSILDDDGCRSLVVIRGKAVVRPVVRIRSTRSINQETENEKVKPILPLRGIEAYCNLMMLGPLSGDVNELLHGISGTLEESGCDASVELVPFAFVDGDHCVYVNAQKCHPPPYKMDDRSMIAMEYSPYPFTSPSEDFKYLAAMWDRHKLFLIEKEFTSVGICKKQGGHLEIEPCYELPYFMCEMTKDEIEEHLKLTSTDYFWFCIMSGLFAFTTLGYAVVRFNV